MLCGVLRVPVGCVGGSQISRCLEGVPEDERQPVRDFLKGVLGLKVQKKKEGEKKDRSPWQLFLSMIWPTIFVEVKELHKKGAGHLVHMSATIRPEECVFEAGKDAGPVIQQLKTGVDAADVGGKLCAYLLGRVLFMAAQHHKANRGAWTDFLKSNHLHRATAWRYIRLFMLLRGYPALLATTTSRSVLLQNAEFFSRKLKAEASEVKDMFTAAPPAVSVDLRIEPLIEAAAPAGDAAESARKAIKARYSLEEFRGKEVDANDEEMKEKTGSATEVKPEHARAILADIVASDDQRPRPRPRPRPAAAAPAAPAAASAAAAAAAAQERVAQQVYHSTSPPDGLDVDDDDPMALTAQLEQLFVGSDAGDDDDE